jgi:hypothetical protein
VNDTLDPERVRSGNPDPERDGPVAGDSPAIDLRDHVVRADDVREVSWPWSWLSPRG